MQQSHRGWYRELNRYHWFVLAIAALGWLFDTMDQQLFNLARKPAMDELLKAMAPEMRAHYAGLATSIFLIGWATGGLVFGVLGDRIGRAKTMMITILVYSLCTGLSAFSQGFGDFAFFRFLTGLGVGGEFAVGVALVAESMPERARPFALGSLQTLSTVGNMMAAVMSISLGHLEETGALGSLKIFGVQMTAWRLMFVIGTVPALLAVFIRRRLKEPAAWQAAVAAEKTRKQLGSYVELLGDVKWRKRAIVGMLLAASGVMGLWGVGFFAIDLNRAVFRKMFEEEYRQQGEAARDREFVRLALRDPADALALVPPVDAATLLSDKGEPVAGVLYGTILTLQKEGKTVDTATVLVRLDGSNQTPGQRQQRQEYLDGAGAPSGTIAEHGSRITSRASDMGGRLYRWGGYTSIMLNLGAFFGMYSFTMITSRIGRRPAFAIASVASTISTAVVFWCMSTRGDIFWMLPIMGFCQLSLFGGYAIYLPELFPTRLRSTGTSFCYNVGRFLAAAAPYTFGSLTSYAFSGAAEPMRNAGVAMSLVFLLALLVLPFAPETRGQPLPE